jgi:outer membrane protein, heavy metal efflux system
MDMATALLRTDFPWTAFGVAAALCLSSGGCQTGLGERTACAQPQIAKPHVAEVAQHPGENSTHATPLQTVVYSATPGDERGLPTATDSSELTLDLELLVETVLAVHPDIRSARVAWRAAAARYPQEISLDDPMFGVMLGPGSWGSDEVDSAYTLEASQKVPWPGKRQLRGDIAQSEANAAFFTIEEERLRLAEATRVAYFEYFLAHRQLALLDESTSLLESLRAIALRKFEAAEAEQQDVLLADVELGELERQRLAALQTERVIRARLNTLLLQPPGSPLLPPPSALEIEISLPTPDELQARALAQRPELAGQAALIRRERYAAALARKEFYPDMEFVARYDAFWQEEPLRPMVGMNVNVPIYKQKRYAAVREANARGAQEQAKLEAQANEIGFRVEQSYQRVLESDSALRVYRERILPASRHSVEAAQASYTAGRLDFLRLVQSQRQLLIVEEGYYRAVAEYHQRLAELEREVGAPLE